MTANTPFPTFAEFFEAIHGNTPYPWQEELAERLKTGDWPQMVEVPTGLGKTTTIAAAVYELARQSHLILNGELARRSAPQRLFHVVNRRTLVEDTGSYIERLADKVNKPPRDLEAVLSPVRQALATLTGEEDAPPIIAEHLHGKRRPTKSWQRATGCTIVSLTPHQFVSRLLMRGFGVAAGSRSIDAGLTGIDRLVLFDEPHLASPAIHAILDAERMQNDAPHQLGVPLGSLVVLGATPSEELRQTLGTDDPARVLTTEIRNSGTTSWNAELKRRITARRDLELCRVKQASDSAFAKELARQATQAFTKDERIVVFTNTVSLAQDVFAQLSKGNIAARLVTSRFRPFDRSASLTEQASITVTTQCLEVGVDLSFDVLISELCPWPTLIQRLGRLNRDGASNATASANALVVTQEAGKLRAGSSAVYPKATLEAMHQVLVESTEESGGIADVSLSGLQRLRERVDVSALEGPDSRAGTLHRGLVPVMTQTRPTPYPDLPVGAFIAGPDAEPNLDLLVVWRSWLLPLVEDGGGTYSSEQLSVPVSAVRQFLTNPAKPTQVADNDQSEKDKSKLQREFDVSSVLVRDQQNERWVHPTGIEDLYTTDQIILASELGGYSAQLGWTGKNNGPVSDISLVAALEEAADLEYDSTFYLNFSGSAIQELRAYFADRGHSDKAAVCDELEDNLQTLSDIDETNAVEVETAENQISAAAIRLLPEQEQGSLHADLVRRELGWVSVQFRVHRVPEKSRRIDLDGHQRAVAATTMELARAAGVRGELLPHLVVAARHHDDGKEDERFQRLLRGNGSTVESSQPLAKSVTGIIPGSPRDRKLRQQIGLPAGWRHEAESLRRFEREVDDLLVRHLIGSHHGWYRPGFRPVAPQQVEGFSHADEFVHLNELFGPWGLAYLETILRLADRSVSRTDAVSDIEPQYTASNLTPLIHHKKVLPPARSGARQEHVLSGMIDQPALGWYSAAGLLGASAVLGDPAATVKWTAPGEGTAPLIPTINSKVPLSELVEYLCAPERWDQAESQTAKATGKVEGCGPKYGGIARQHQKIEPASAVRALLLEIASVKGDAAAVSDLILGIVGDLSSAGDGQLDLPLSAWANNSSYPRVAVEYSKKPECKSLAESSLLSQDSGYVLEKCDGGLDRHPGLVPLANGLGGRDDSKYTRAFLAPLVVSGMAFLGHTGIHPLGLDKTGRRGYDSSTEERPKQKLRLPVSTEEITLATLRAYAASAWANDWDWKAVGQRWVLDFERNYRGEAEIFWVGKPQVRSTS